MRTTFAVLVALFTFASFGTNAWAADVVDSKPFEKLLKKYVDSKGGVNYAGWKENAEDKAALDAYVTAVGDAKVEGSDAARLAFYVNAYNALVLKAILDKYPIESVMKVPGFFKETKHKVAGKDLTLDQLENEVIRKEFAEPRIHFVLVCGAKSCPPLQRKAATEKNLEGLLESSTKSFVPRATRVEEGKITTSKLFEWFKDDFVKKEGSVAKFVAKYAPKHAEALLAEGAVIGFSHYSWKLNAQ